MCDHYGSTLSRIRLVQICSLDSLDMHCMMVLGITNSKVLKTVPFQHYLHSFQSKQRIKTSNMTVTLDESKRDTLDEPIIKLHIHEENQYQDTREGAIHKKEDLESSRRTFLRSMNSAIHSDSQTLRSPFLYKLISYRSPSKTVKIHSLTWTQLIVVLLSHGLE